MGGGNFYFGKSQIFMVITLPYKEIVYRGGDNVLGLNDPGIALAYILCIGSTILCLAYAVWGSKKET